MDSQQNYQNNSGVPQMIMPNQAAAPQAQQPQMIMPEQQAQQMGMPPVISGQQAVQQAVPMQTPQTVMPSAPQTVMPNQQQAMQMPGQAMPGQAMPGQATPVQMQGGAMSAGQQMQAQNMQNANAANMGSAAMAAQKAKPSSTKKEEPISTQATLLISELRDNVVIMKDGSFRAVVACKSINFDLMSEVEREGVEYSYQNFLNSLKFTTQILIRSQRVDIGPYIDKLSEIRRKNDNMLLGVLMDDYINFIDVLSQEANIMDKTFFIVIPYYISEDAEKTVQQTKNFFKAFSKSKGPDITRIDRATYDKALTELTNRVDSVVSGLFQIGIHSVRLNTKELAELYYNFNNPDTAVREPLVDFSKLASIYVKKGVREEGSTE